MPGLWDPTESKASENKFLRGMCLPNRATENKRYKQITPQILMGRKRRRKHVCAGGLEGCVSPALLVDSQKFSSRRARPDGAASYRQKVVVEPRETASQPLIPQHLWISGEQTQKGHLGAGG